MFAGIELQWQLQPWLNKSNIKFVKQRSVLCCQVVVKKRAPFFCPFCPSFQIHTSDCTPAEHILSFPLALKMGFLIIHWFLLLRYSVFIDPVPIASVRVLWSPVDTFQIFFSIQIKVLFSCWNKNQCSVFLSNCIHKLLFTTSFQQQCCNSYSVGGYGVKIHTRWIEVSVAN